jgi:4-hydroxy-2-oxoglutarate aldolase
VTAPQLSGVFAPITTPFDAQGELATDAHADNLARLSAAGLDGFLVAGSTGEAPLLSPEEQQRLVAASRAALPRGKWLLVGTGAESTRQSIALGRAAGREGADAVVVRPPAYYGAVTPPAALAAHFRAIADASPIPVLVYNMPKFTHVSLPPALLADLATHPNIVGVKDSSGDPANVAAYRAAVPHWTVLAGSAALLLRVLELHCQGGVVGVACFAPQACVGLVAAFRAGDRARAAALQEIVGPLDREVVARLGPAGVKAAMDAAGLYGGPVRPPLQALDAADRERIARLLPRD